VANNPNKAFPTLHKSNSSIGRYRYIGSKWAFSLNFHELQLFRHFGRTFYLGHIRP
jgi:hypothetical protein